MESTGLSEHIIIPINYIERKPDSDEYRIVKKGITVEFLSRLIDDPDWPVERICENYGLTPAEVHAAWAFYYDHQEEIDRRLDESTARFQIAYEENHSRRERLKRQYKAKTGRNYPEEET
jgi:uncharacterized protein (DUF433 family)